MLNLTDYQETELLYTGTRTLVYHATRLKDDQPVIIKVLRNLHPHFNELVQFRNQYVITQNLDNPFIVKPLALEQHSNGYALVMPDQGAVSLCSYWQGKKHELHELLRIAIQLATALHTLAGQQIIHKDIKPANILIHPQTQQVQLIDFSIASLLPKEQHQLVSPQGLEGTLVYISPEQTGRMNRGIDYRTDFYSLGVTLYELLVGEAPFTDDDPLELIHAHIAQAPVPPSNRLATQGQPKISGLSAIIMKLMAKNAEDRYQSALGLKHDLEQCLRSLEETGEIVEFDLGERDVCDRFNIPEKLYGREADVQTLLNAFDRVANGNSEIMLVAGFSGIGKTAVINEVHKPIVRQRGYFIKGKFDQFNRDIPFSAFVQAFRSLMGQILGESDAELAAWKDKILTALGENSQVLIDVIPELEQVIGVQPPAPELSGSAAQNRFNLLFETFIAVFTTPEHPMVIFLDDLQWADSASLNLLNVLMGDRGMGYLLLLGAYRDNEVSPAHPLMLTLDEMIEVGIKVQTINLYPLSESSINQLITDTLGISESIVQSLTEVVFKKTQGNPFFVTQLLEFLYQEKIISFDYESGHWQYEIVRVWNAILTGNVLEFMVLKLQKLPPSTQEVLRLAACIGAQFDLATLAIAAEQSKTNAAVALWHALQVGLIVPTNQAYQFFQSREEAESGSDVNPIYRFLHDRVQQAAYSLIPEAQKQLTHWKIGQLLLKKLSQQEQFERIFEIVNQLNFGLNFIQEKIDQDQLIQLNLIAGRRAKTSTAYAAATQYFEMGRTLLNSMEKISHSSNVWVNNYILNLAFYEELAEVSYLNADFLQAEKFSGVVLQQAKTLLDKVNAYITRIQSRIAQSKLIDAIQVALPVLNELDDSIDLPEHPQQTNFEQQLRKTQDNLANQSISDLLCLPIMEDTQQLAIMSVLASIAPPAYFAFPTLLPLIAMKMVNVSVQFGNTSTSAFGYAMYGFILCGLVNDIQSGCQFGKLSLDLVNRNNFKDTKAKVLLLAGAFINHWQQSGRESLTLLPKAYQMGLESGDLEFAGYAASFYGFHRLLIGKRLVELETELKSYGEKVAQIKQEHVLYQLYLSRQVVLNLIDYSENPCHLVGEAYDEEKMIPVHECDNNRTTLAFFYIAKLSLHYLFKEYDLALSMAERAEQYLDGVVSMLCVAVFHFYDALVSLAQCSGLEPVTEAHPLLKKVRNHQTKMQRWADHAPMNFQHKLDLIEAEHSRVMGRMAQAIEHYDRAIAGAKANRYRQEEAIANELAAQFYLGWGKKKVAASYMQEAYYCYSRWGAKAKITHLERTYPQLLDPILQQGANLPFSVLETVSTLAVSDGDSSVSTAKPSISSSSSTNINFGLDFVTILRAAQLLTSTIDLNTLIEQLTRIILQNSGGDRVVLVLPDEVGHWSVKAITTAEATQICLKPLAESLNHLPIKLIQYVKHTYKTVLIDEANVDSPVLSDYVLKYQPQSGLCLPLLNQGSLIGILYLENRIVRGVFTPDRQTVLNFLSSQAAIALQNAQLYGKVQQTLQDLQQAQLQLVQNEKMSTLGNLVAGVAHEINNPLGFIGGNVTILQDNLADLSAIVDGYRVECPNPSPQLAEEIEELDLDFLLEDIPKTIASMKEGVKRIGNISTSLRTFSRTDTDHKTEFQVQDGIDSTLLILKYRLKANEERPAIEIVKNYGETPEVKCYAGQLNQVFMNLLANAIDALEESNQEKTFKALEQEPNCITVSTVISEDKRSIIVRIADNGIGMPDEVKVRIFEQGFTTKDVGKGTGLGMAIAHQIITEKHGGTIECYSQLGQGTTFTICLPLEGL
ncbi:MAG: AAA family ATPase [Cyanobacteria bacterium P01_G01_bin.54]